MKTKRLLLVLSIAFSCSFLLTSCEKDGDMGIGESIGSDPPNEKKLSKGLQSNNTATFDLNKE